MSLDVMIHGMPDYGIGYSHKFIEFQEVPSPSNCPILDENGMCMCASMACDDVKDFHCASMRYAFTYGYNTMAQIVNDSKRTEKQ